ncbi:MAG: alkaline phosphatase family protein [Bdellovibrionota bacterium]
MKTIMLALLLCTACAQSPDTATNPASPTTGDTPREVVSVPMDPVLPGSRFKHVVQVIFENTNYASALKQPDFAALVKRGALMTKLSAQNHPSEGNYIAMIAGDTYGVASDANVNLSARHIGDLLEEAHLDWKVYAEGFPGNCYMGSSKGKYVRKHTPFVSFTNVTSNAKRCAKIEDETGFESDVQNHALPAYSMYVPNLNNDGHDTGVSYAGKYLTKKFAPILDNPSLMADTLFIFTFDENEGASGNQVFTVLVGGAVKPGTTFNGALSHPSLIRLVEDEFRLGSLHKLDEKSNLIEGIWK